MLTWLLGKPMMLLALVAVISVACWGATCQCRKILYPPVPRPPKTRDYEVVRAETGASLTVKAGRKRTNTVHLAGIAAPPVGSKYAEAARQSLERLAGGTIVIEMPRGGLFRCDAHDSLRRQEEEPEATADSAADRLFQYADYVYEGVCPECNGTRMCSGGKLVTCPLCDGKGCGVCGGDGELRLDYVTIACCQLLVSKHVDRLKCPECRAGGMCNDARKELTRILADATEPVPGPCPVCSGYQPPTVLCGSPKEADEQWAETWAERGVISGTVYGSSGVCLNRQQVAEGWATCNDSAPKEWKAVQTEARKQKRGMWQ
jgi:endonuclease YncB( thermonuclease family)